MKTLIILLLVLSTLLIGCATTPSDEGEAQGEVSQAEALEEVDDSLIAEDEEIEIGEMI